MILSVPIQISLKQAYHANISNSDKIENFNNYLEPYHLRLRGYATAQQLTKELNPKDFKQGLRKIKKYLNPKPLEQAHYFTVDIADHTIHEVNSEDVKNAYQQTKKLLKDSSN